MKTLRVLLGLPLNRWVVLARALLWLWVVRLGLWLLPYSQLRRLLQGDARYAPESLDTLLWAFKRASTFVPKATCLTQALAAHHLLTRYAHRTDLNIGVAKDGDNLAAHAWLSQGQHVIIGEIDNLSRYHVLQPSS